MLTLSLRKAKHYQIQLNKKQEEMIQLRTKLDKGLLGAKEFELESLQIEKAYPLVQTTPTK